MLPNLLRLRRSNTMSYLKGLPAFIGLTDVTVVRAEGLRIGPAAKAAAIDAANAEITALAA